MNIKGQGHSLTLVRFTTFSNFFSLETARPIEAKFHVDPPLEGGIKVCSNGPGHKTNMAAMPICGKNLKKSSLQHWVLKYYQFCSDDAPSLTWTYFTARSDLVPLRFCMRKR